VASILGVGTARLDDPASASLEELAFAAASAALADAGRARSDLDGICLAASDQLDGRSISSMHLAGPSGGYLLDEIKVTEDGAAALAAAVMRLEAGASRLVLAISWTKSSESPPGPAEAVNSDPVYERPLGITALAREAVLTQQYVDRLGLDLDQIDELARSLAPSPPADELLAWPIRSLHVPPPTDGAVAVVVGAEPGGVEVAGLHWGVHAADPLARPLPPDEALAAIAARAYAEAGLTPSAGVPVETTDRTTFRLCMAAAGLGLVAPADAPRALLAGELPHLNASGGLWAANPIFAAGLERVVRAVEHVRAGAPAAVAHSSYGAAGQGHLVAVLRAAR
jgi:acetyl-CoA acetyltransferase